MLHPVAEEATHRGGGDVTGSGRARPRWDGHSGLLTLWGSVHRPAGRAAVVESPGQAVGAPAEPAQPQQMSLGIPKRKCWPLVFILTEESPRAHAQPSRSKCAS